jgi:hypothetical protein
MVGIVGRKSSERNPLSIQTAQELDDTGQDISAQEQYETYSSGKLKEKLASRFSSRCIVNG